MNRDRRAAGRWLVGIVAFIGPACIVQSSALAQTTAVSRAVEVAPPKGWTPDTPLFKDEPSATPPRRDPPRAQAVSERKATRVTKPTLAPSEAVKKTRLTRLETRKSPGAKAEKVGRVTGSKSTRQARGKDTSRRSGQLAQSRPTAKQKSSAKVVAATTLEKKPKARTPRDPRATRSVRSQRSTVQRGQAARRPDTAESKKGRATQG